MSASVASPPAEPATLTAGPRRLRPHQLVLGLGVFAGLFTLLSGVLPLWTGWNDVSPISREVFSGVPDPLVVAFYAVIPVLLVYVSYLFSLRVRNWERGTPDRRATTGRNARRRLEDYRAGVYMRTLLRDPAAGLMHSLIYFGFLVLLAVTATLEIDHQVPRASSSCTARRTRRSPSWATPPASCSWPASPGPSAAATSSARTASASRPSPSTPSSSACSS
jgi:hypothetical protein